MMNRKSWILTVALAISTPALAQKADNHYLTDFLYPEIGAPEQNVDCSIFFEKRGRRGPQQGLEMYGKYIFSVEDGGNVNVYDFRKKTLEPLASFALASSMPDNHANNVEFGVEKKKGASFPLMYVSVGKVGVDIEWLCFVESITRKGKTFSSEIAQTIHLDGSNWKDFGYKPIFGAPSWLVDKERGYLWVFSAKQRTVAKVTKDPKDNEYIATKFRIPKLSEGKDVYLSGKDILAQVVFPYEVWFTQAGCIHDGKIFYGYGIGKKDPTRPSRIRVYDTDTGKIAARYELQDQIEFEIEDIVIRDGWMYVNANNNPKKTDLPPYIYKVSLPAFMKK